MALPLSYGGPVFWAIALLSFSAAFIIWAQILECLSGGRLFHGAPFGIFWQKSTGLIIISAPLLGLLGTIRGLRIAFDGLSGQMENLAAGLGEALISTKDGLILALITLIASRLLKYLWERQRGAKGTING